MNYYLFLSHNGTVCTVKRDGRSGGVQIITFTEKLTNLKYELLMAYLEQVIYISRYVKFRYKNESGKVFSTIVRTKHSVVRADKGV